jgi:hypothetical protein
MDFVMAQDFDKIHRFGDLPVQPVSRKAIGGMSSIGINIIITERTMRYNCCETQIILGIEFNSSANVRMLLNWVFSHRQRLTFASSAVPATAATFATAASESDLFALGSGIADLGAGRSCGSIALHPLILPLIAADRTHRP